MKTGIVVAGVVVVLAAAYAGSTYHHSKQSEATARKWSEKVAQVPNLKVSGSDYQRGFFRSTQDVTVELGLVPGVNTPRTVTFHNVIYHGPLPGFRTLGIARVEHSLVFDAVTSKELAKAFGEASPIAATTTVTLGGESITEVRGAPATYKSGDEVLVWQGVSGTVRIAKDISSYSVDATAPGMQVNGKDGIAVNIKGLSLKTSQNRMANTENLFLGVMTLGLENLSVAKNGKSQFEMKNVALISDASSNNPEFIDMVGRLTAGEVASAVFNATNVEYAFSAKHVHAASLDKLSKGMQDARATMGAGGAANPQAVQAAMFQVVSTHGMALLQREPVIAIERIGFVSKEGETKITGSARLVGVTEADVQNPLGLIAKVQAEANIRVSEPFLAVMSEAPINLARAQGREPTAEEVAKVAAVRPGIDEKLAALVAAGYVIRDNGVLTSKLSFKNGVFTVNDKPFNPAAVQ